MIRITFISDTHNKHKSIPLGLLPGGDLLIHSGDMSSMGYQHEIREFCKWFSSVPGYEEKIFIAGNHDWGFQSEPSKVAKILEAYPGVTYLQDELFVYGDDYETAVKIYGAPWQPEFCNWAFNLPRNGEELQQRWADIPANTDILITHGPAWGRLDTILGRTEHLGCELLADRIAELKPKIHVCGHIHTGYGYLPSENTHFFNAAVLNERYEYAQKPITIDWDPATNQIEFVD